MRKGFWVKTFGFWFLVVLRYIGLREHAPRFRSVFLFALYKLSLYRSDLSPASTTATLPADLGMWVFGWLLNRKPPNQKLIPERVSQCSKLKSLHLKKPKLQP